MDNSQNELNGHSSNKEDIASKKLQELTRSGLNRTTGGAWNKVRNAPIVGKKLQNAENNLANKLGNTRLGKNLTNPENHQRPNLGAEPQKTDNKNGNIGEKASTPKTPSAKKNDIGSRNLNNSLANRARNIINNRKKKKQETAPDTSNSSNDDNQSSSNLLDDMFEKRKKRIKIKIMIYTAIGLLVAIMIGTLFMAIFGIDISVTVPAINQGSYGTDKFVPTNEEKTKEYKDEINYYKKIIEENEKYSKENHEDIKSGYIHAVLIYLYYQLDLEIKNDSNDSIPVDYNKMADMVEKIIPLMKPSDSSKMIDYDKNGEYYNNLKNSADFKEYYKEVLKEKKIDDLLDEIFDLAEELDEIDYSEETVITTETEVKVDTSVDKKSGSKSKTLSMNSYLADSIYANDISLSNQELVKAYTVMYSTNLAANNKSLKIDSAASISNSMCSVSLGCSYDKNNNIVDGPGERSDKNTIYYSGGYYYKQPLTTAQIENLNKSVNSVFGNVLVKEDGTYPSLDIDKLNGLGDGSYQEILKDGYGSYKIKNIGENSYILDASYGDKKVLTNVTMYDQSDYKTSFCGLKKETIATSGCGVTSMAMVLSTYEKSNTYTPLWTNDLARTSGHCGAGRGTDYAHFKTASKKLGYSSPTIYAKSSSNGWKISKVFYNNVLKNLSQGNLVIVHVMKGHFTGGGHYMVLGGIDPSTKKVYVYDPNNKSNTKNRSTGNGWYSFNDIIVPEAKAFIIIKKKG